MFGWFMSIIFYPSLGGILAWVAGRFTVEMFGWDVNPLFSAQTYVLALFYLVLIFSMNALSPKLAGKFHVSTTFIKLVPLIGMGVVGTTVGMFNGVTVENLRSDYVYNVVPYPFLSALIATVFAYVGWDSVLSLNSEIKNSKRNLPIALIVGMCIIMTIYVLYTVGLFGSVALPDLSVRGGVLNAFQGVFGSAAGAGLFAFIVVSTLGALNGITVAGQRAFYITAVRGRGLNPKVFSQVDPITNASNNSAILFVLIASVWAVVNAGNFAGWYGGLNFDIMGFVPITFQTMLVPVYVWVIFREKDLGVFNRFIAPLIAAGGSLFLVYAIVTRDGMRVLWYLGVFAVIMAVGAIFAAQKPKNL